MMRREGYPPKTAAAIEASASTGGQIMPPVMGAAAFLMVEYTRIPYSTIILHALLPGLMFYLAIWFAVHWQGIKLGMQGLPKDQLPAWRKVMHEGGLHFMSLDYAMTTTVLIAIAVSLVCALLQKSSRHLVTVKNLVGAISDGFRDSVALLTSAACAGIIIGVVTQTSFGLKISTLVIDASMGYLWLALMLCAIVCLILGMGLPTQIVYLTLAVLVAPTIVEMGVTMAGAHLFIIYFGMMSMVTPPVCFAAFAAAGIAGSKLMETGWEATRLSAAGIIVPFYFVYHPGILLIGDLLAIIEGVSRASLGLYAAGVALGMFVWRGRELAQSEFSIARIVSRVAAFAACILLCAPGMVTLAAGVMMAALSFAIAALTSPRVDGLAA
jgi:TRAP transporter 4TM/12TM fusion protein